MTKLTNEVEDIRSNAIYRNAFEWRFEFPEVLNSEGEYEGFDVVIGNPPYIEHKKLAYISEYLKINFKVYFSSADISNYFFEQGFRVLKKSGLLSFISTNKFFKTDYGKPLRKFLSDNRIISIINFEQVPIFDAALVSSFIVIVKKVNSKNRIEYCQFEKEKSPNLNFLSELKNRLELLEINTLSESPWSFKDKRYEDVFQKIIKNGKSIKDIGNIEIKRGVTTGFDPAFIISKEKAMEFLKINKENEKNCQTSFERR
jgi:adenine-specific DNA-methyltransferase